MCIYMNYIQNIIYINIYIHNVYICILMYIISMYMYIITNFA